MIFQKTLAYFSTIAYNEAEKNKKVEGRKMERKRKYYQLTFWYIPEIYEKLEDLSHYYMKEYLRKYLNNDVKSFLTVPRTEADQFFSNGYIRKRVYISKEIHEKWRPLPQTIKKRLYYLVNKKILSEVLKDDERKQPTES